MSAARARRQAATSTTLAVDVVAIAPRDGQLLILLAGKRTTRHTAWSLPWDGARSESLDAAARRVATEAGIRSPAVQLQVAAVADRAAHPGDAGTSVAYLILTRDVEPAPGFAWCELAKLPNLSGRHARLVDASVARLRELAVAYSLALSLLDECFSLAEVQAMYELLLGRAVHKASFRRTLHGSGLVEPTGEWRADRRGRPAQLYRRSDGVVAPALLAATARSGSITDLRAR
jgi:8-oxo-dGTP diphosphatase